MERKGTRPSSGPGWERLGDIGDRILWLKVSPSPMTSMSLNNQ